jgi:hypothetical protein
VLLGRQSQGRIGEAAGMDADAGEWVLVMEDDTVD